MGNVESESTVGTRVVNDNIHVRIDDVVPDIPLDSIIQHVGPAAADAVVGADAVAGADADTINVTDAVAIADNVVVDVGADTDTDVDTDADADAGADAGADVDTDADEDPFKLDNLGFIVTEKLTLFNYIENINNYLKELNITIDIRKLYSILNAKQFVNLEEYFPIITNMGSDTFKCKLKNGKKIKFKVTEKIAEGSFNAVYKCTTNSPVFRTVVLRKTLKSNKTAIYQSIYENIKHIILYLINRANIGKKYQLVPTPLFMGIYKNAKGESDLFFLMEKGDYTLDEGLHSIFESIMNDTFADNDKMKLKVMTYSFYKFLTLLNEKLDYFAHSDFKFNNALLKNGKIMLIDFGFSSFKLFDLVFRSEHNSIYYPSFEKQYNPVQDLCQMLSSINFVVRDFLKKKEIYTQSNLTKIINKLDEAVNIPGKNFIGYKIFSESFIKSFEKHTHYSEIWRLFYKENFHNINLEFTSFISTNEMKTDYGITFSAKKLYNHFYYQKYLKYKKKYITLKKNKF